LKKYAIVNNLEVNNMIYTSYFTKIKQLEKNGIIPILICGKTPDWYKGAAI